MRFGCLGCFVLILILAVVLVGGATALFFAGLIFDIPTVPQAPYTASDGYRAQEKLFELILRDSGRSSRREPLLITERELNAFLARHLEEREGMPFSPLVVKLTPDTMEAQGQTKLKNLFKGFPFYLLVDYLPASTMDRPVWVTVRGRISVTSGSGGRTRYGEVTLTDFTLGKQPLGISLLYVMLGPSGAGLLRWQVPTVVESIEVDDGRLIIRTGTR